MPHIRPATAADARMMMQVRTSVRENVVTKERLLELGINEQSIAGMINSTHSCFCAVIGSDQQVIGFSMGDRAQGEVFALFVHPAHEGTGLGKSLLQALLNDLHQRGHHKITLTTEPDSRAFGFYRKQGFAHVGFALNGEAKLELIQPEKHHSGQLRSGRFRSASVCPFFDRFCA